MIGNMKNKNNLKLIVSASPHLVSGLNTQKIMLYVVIALMPSLVASTWIFGFRAFALTVFCVAACMIFEYIFNLIAKKPQTTKDLSAVVTGILLAFNLPVSLPYWIAAVGCFIAIIIVKQLFGGIGKNIVNPAITARVVLLVSFPAAMTTWQATRFAGDAVSGATPLGMIKEGLEVPSNMDLFLGNVGGSMGEVSALALLIGFAFLLFKKVVSPLIPICYLAVVFFFALAAGEDPLFHIFAGGVMLGALFMATDYVTTPVLPPGQIIFGLGCGFITMVIRIWGAYPEGVSFSILLMNILVPHIDRLCDHIIFKVKTVKKKSRSTKKTVMNNIKEGTK
ncbi:MAG: RnfABCDGE type electron transport complex subunit D [Eubacteriales bacterium]|nr:RnfABCDGE type electron transport complex subunit D [Eubacteriales bacterium]